MGNAIIGCMLRLWIAACGCAAGAVCAFTAFSNGMLMDAGDAGRWFGIGFVAIVVFSWLILPTASWCGRLGASHWSWGLRAAWVPLFGFVIGNAIMFTAQHRTETVEGKGVVINRFQDAKADKERLLAELDTLKTNPAWAASSGCTATAQGSKKLCDQVRDVQRRIQEVQAIIAAGRPGAKDAGAETLAWMLQGDAVKVGKAWPIYIAVMLELAASLAMKLALSPWTPKVVRLHSAKPAIEKDAQNTVTPDTKAKGEPDALAQIKALVLASPDRELVSSVRWLSNVLGVARSTLHDRLNNWHAQGVLDVERNEKQTVVRLPKKAA